MLDRCRWLARRRSSNVAACVPLADVVPDPVEERSSASGGVITAPCRAGALPSSSKPPWAARGLDEVGDRRADGCRELRFPSSVKRYFIARAASATRTHRRESPSELTAKAWSIGGCEGCLPFPLEPTTCIWNFDHSSQDLVGHNTCTCSGHTGKGEEVRSNTRGFSIRGAVCTHVDIHEETAATLDFSGNLRNGPKTRGSRVLQRKGHIILPCFSKNSRREVCKASVTRSLYRLRSRMSRARCPKMHVPDQTPTKPTEHHHLDFGST